MSSCSWSDAFPDPELPRLRPLRSGGGPARAVSSDSCKCLRVGSCLRDRALGGAVDGLRRHHLPARPQGTARSPLRRPRGSWLLRGSHPLRGGPRLQGAHRGGRVRDVRPPASDLGDTRPLGASRPRDRPRGLQQRGRRRQRRQDRLARRRYRRPALRQSDRQQRVLHRRARAVASAPNLRCSSRRSGGCAADAIN